jgi:UDP-hydrolysing UDP-N-acetyl-D-glucosamine 2-epimerase
MKKRKIFVTTGSRSEYGILRSIIQEISNSKKLDLFLIVTGMHLSKKFGFTINEIKKDGFKIYKQIPVFAKNDSLFDMSKTLGNQIIQFSEIFRKQKPDINLILGDRDEALSSTISAYHMNIPNAHIHGGDRSKAGIDEYNRHAITKMSNIHFAATKKSKNRIIKMGENPKYVFFTGSPSIDEIVNKKITTKSKLEEKYNINFSDKEILLLFHPVTTESQNSEKEVNSIINAILKIKQQTIIIAPNSDPGNEKIFQAFKKLSLNNKICKFYKNMPREDYLGMLKNCRVLVGNSSSGIIEASYFKIPVVNIGIRQKDREKGPNV